MYQTKQKTTVKWKRFSGAHYAAFQSLHKEVRIGVLTVAMLSTVGLKAQKHEVSVESRPATDSIREELLEDVEVLATRVALAAEQAPRMVTVLHAADIAAAAAHSVNDLLNLAVGVDVRQRGAFGVQTDVSVGGGNFDQLTVLLNGVNISSPQTGHLTADFPVAVQDIERIEVIDGPAARVFGTSAFTGVINIVTRTQAGSSIHLYGGSYGLAGGDVHLGFGHRAAVPLSEQAAKVSHHVSGGYGRSDGATDNSDFQASRGFYQGRLTQRDLQMDWQLGYSYKQYGANTFYGASSTDQWESNERMMGALSMRNRIGQHGHVGGQANWNRWYDHYQWHRGTSPGGENFHRTDALGGSLTAGYDTRHTASSLSVEVRHESIYSTNLGRLMDESQWLETGGVDADAAIRYKRHSERTNYNVFAEHNVLLRQWTVSLGVLANYNTGYDRRWRLFPGIDVSYRPTQHWRLFASWNMALRMPTFTDLYYTGTNIEGNSELRPERTSNVSVGLRFRRPGWVAEAQGRYSHKRDMIDWVLWADGDGKTFKSTNFKLDNVGVTTHVAWMPSEVYDRCPLRRLSVQWAWMDQTSDYDRPILASKYAMQYLRHKVVAQADMRLWRQLTLGVSCRWMDRIGNDNPSYAVVDARLAWEASRWTAYVDGNNVLNRRYYEYVFVRQPGCVFRGGFAWRF